MGQMFFPDEEPSNGNRWGWVSGILIAACLLYFAYPYINLPSWLKDLPFTKNSLWTPLMEIV